MAPVTTPTNGVQSHLHQQQQKSQSNHHQQQQQSVQHHLGSEHCESSSREYVNIPQTKNVPHSSSAEKQFRTRSSLSSSLDQKSHGHPADKSYGHEHFDGPTERSSFDSSTFPDRRFSATNRANTGTQQTQQQPHSHQQMPLYVNSNSFDNNHKRVGNSSSFDDVSAYTNIAFVNPQLHKSISVSQSEFSYGIFSIQASISQFLIYVISGQKTFECPPNYIQLGFAATGETCNGVTSPSSQQSQMNGAKSLSSLSRGQSPQRLASGSVSGSSNSLNRSSPKRMNHFITVQGRSYIQQNRIPLDAPVPLPSGLSYAKIDFEKTHALSELTNQARQQCAVNGNY